MANVCLPSIIVLTQPKHVVVVEQPPLYTRLSSFGVADQIMDRGRIVNVHVICQSVLGRTYEPVPDGDWGSRVPRHSHSKHVSNAAAGL